MRQSANLVILLVTMLLTACGTPGPGILADSLSKGYYDRRTSDETAALRELLASRPQFANVSGIVTYAKDPFVGHFGTFKVLVSGRVSSETDLIDLRNGVEEAITLTPRDITFDVDVRR